MRNAIKFCSVLVYIYLLYFHPKGAAFKTSSLMAVPASSPWKRGNDLCPFALYAWEQWIVTLSQVLKCVVSLQGCSFNLSPSYLMLLHYGVCLSMYRVRTLWNFYNSMTFHDLIHDISEFSMTKVKQFFFTVVSKQSFIYHIFQFYNP